MSDYDEKLERVNKILRTHSFASRPCYGQVIKPALKVKINEKSSKLPDKPFDFPKQPAPEKTTYERAQDKLERQRTQTGPKSNLLTPKPKV